MISDRYVQYSVLYGYAAWSVALREEWEQYAENIYTKKGSGSSRLEKISDEEVCNLCSSPYITRMIKSSMMRSINIVACVQSFGRNCEGKRPLGRPGCRQGIALEWIFKELVECYIHLAQDSNQHYADKEKLQNKLNDNRSFGMHKLKWLSLKQDVHKEIYSSKGSYKCKK